LLARLSDADLANAWRLAEYLLLDGACFTCLEDVVVQRALRTGTDNQLLPSLVMAHLGVIAVRTAALRQLATYHYFAAHDRVARGLDVPTGALKMAIAAKWGHWDMLLQARAAGVPWNEDVTNCAARGGHLRLLQQLRQAGCPWNNFVVWGACEQGHDKLAVWALDNGAPTFSYWLGDAAQRGRLTALRWAQSKARLSTADIPLLREVAAKAGHNAVVAWLDRL
jgi:hypothetical protein